MTSSTTQQREKLPVSGLVVLAVAGFLTMLTETVPAGLLPEISTGLQVSAAEAGQLVTLYAAGSVLAAIPVTAMTRGLPRRPLLLATVLAVAAVNVITAVSDSYEVTLVSRVVAGIAAGVQWAMIAGYAMRMVSEHNKGRALAVSMAGVPLALAFGVPVGTFAGALIGWRWTFAAMALVAVVVVVLAWIKLPGFQGEPAGARIPLLKVLARPGLISILLVAFLFEVGHMNLYTYIAPYVSLAGLDSAVGAVLLGFGLAAIVGLWVAGNTIDKNLRMVVLVSLSIFAASMLAFAIGSASPLVVVVAVLFWGFTLGGAPTMLQAASARCAGPATDVAQSMLVTMLNAGMSVGALTGGIALSFAGVGSLAWVSLALFAVALLIAVLARRAGFPPESKTGQAAESNTPGNSSDEEENSPAHG